MGSAYNNPIDNPQDWDYVTIAGIRNPGLAIVGEFKRTSTWDEKNGKGNQGSTITYVGRRAAKGRIIFQLWTAAHFVEWDAFFPLFQYNPGKTPTTGVAISYPALDNLSIVNVVCESIGSIVHKGGQLYEIEVYLMEWYPPPQQAVVSTPVSTVGKGGSTQVVPPVLAQNNSYLENLAATGAVPLFAQSPYVIP